MGQRGDQLSIALPLVLIQLTEKWQRKANDPAFGIGFAAVGHSDSGAGSAVEESHGGRES